MSSVIRAIDTDGVRFSRFWAMPNADTFSIDVIGKLVKRYLRDSEISVDPFARNKLWCTHTNDLNPSTRAEYHMTALEFLKWINHAQFAADLVLFDPPYSRRQTKEVYDDVGLKYQQSDNHNMTRNWRAERDVIDKILRPGGIVISLGWNTSGMGIRRGYEIVELMVINHGGHHNDTLITVERRIAVQGRLEL